MCKVSSLFRKQTKIFTKYVKKTSTQTEHKMTSNYLFTHEFQQNELICNANTQKNIQIF